jgi:hypothetical protein
MAPEQDANRRWALFRLSVDHHSQKAGKGRGREACRRYFFFWGVGVVGFGFAAGADGAAGVEGAFFLLKAMFHLPPA